MSDDLPDEPVVLLEEEKRRQQRRAATAPNPGYVPPPLDYIDPGAWHGRNPPARPWLVPGWIPREEVTLLYGVGGAGKSILSLQLVVAAALGLPWLGLPVERVKCLYFSCEDNENEIWRRLAKILPASNVGFSDLSGNVRVFDRARLKDNALMGYVETEGFGRGPFTETETYGSLYRDALKFGAGLIVIDSLYNAFGGNENNRSEASGFLNSLGAIALDLNGGRGGAIVMLAHPSRAGREDGDGGSTAWSDACRSRLQFRKPEIPADEPEDSDARELICRKMNFGPDGGVIRLRWRDGVFGPEEGQGFGLVDNISRNARERESDVAFLAGLDALTKQGRRVNLHANQSNYAPKAMVGFRCCNGFRRRDLANAMQRLFESGAIRVVEEGPAARRRTYVERANEAPE